MAEEWKENIKPLIMKIYKFNQDKALEIVESQLSDGKKISDATDDDIIKLENVYNQALTYVVQFGL